MTIDLFITLLGKAIQWESHCSLLFVNGSSLLKSNAHYTVSSTHYKQGILFSSGFWGTSTKRVYSAGCYRFLKYLMDKIFINKKLVFIL